jgi:hypothetical protein
MSFKVKFKFSRRMFNSLNFSPRTSAMFVYQMLRHLNGRQQSNSKKSLHDRPLKFCVASRSSMRRPNFQHLLEWVVVVEEADLQLPLPLAVQEVLQSDWMTGPIAVTV